MNIMILAAANSIHTQRWVEGLSNLGHQVTLVSQHSCDGWQPPAGVQFAILPFYGLFGYFVNGLVIKRMLRRTRPDILNVHYASGYGLIGRISRFQPLLLSVWGSDVYDFPYEAWWKRRLLERTLRSATRIASTSNAMAEQVLRLVPNVQIPFITPFGVDLDRFYPRAKNRDKSIVIGTVKTLAPKYGIDTLIQSFAILKQELLNGVSDLDRNIKLRIVGKGPQRHQLQELAKSLGVFDSIMFVGGVPHNEVAEELAGMDIFVALSRLDSESFGVAAIEAGAMGLPVVVSDVGGLPEVVLDETTGLVVPKENPRAAAEAMYRLISSLELRERLGAAARRHVVEAYAWPACLQTMLSAYEATIAKSKTTACGSSLD